MDDVPPQEPDCRFCSIRDGRRDVFAPNPFLPKGLTVPYVDDHLILFADAAPLGPGHTLIVPRAHALSLAALPHAEALRALRIARQAAAHLRTALAVPPGLAPYWFEHGSIKEDEAVGCSTAHAHLHVLFGPCGLVDRVAAAGGLDAYPGLEVVWSSLGHSGYYVIGTLDGPALGAEAEPDPLLRCPLFLRKVIATQLRDRRLADPQRYKRQHGVGDTFSAMALATHKALQGFDPAHTIPDDQPPVIRPPCA